MKTPDQIQQQIRTLIDQEVQRRRDYVAKRLPERCTHNHRQALDFRVRVHDQRNSGYNRVNRTGLPVVQDIGLCLLDANGTPPEEWLGTICDEPVDAQRCPWFNPLKTDVEVREDLRKDLQNPVWVKDNLPEVYTLLWALDREEVVWSPAWWQRVWWWLFPPKLEPRLPAFDPAVLFVPPESSEEEDRGLSRVVGVVRPPA